MQNQCRVAPVYRSLAHWSSIPFNGERNLVCGRPVPLTVKLTDDPL
jgi:hypothetical protein